MPGFSSRAELREVLDGVFGLISNDPEMGPALRDADVPQRFEFSDFDEVLNVRAAREGEPGCLHWEWTDDVSWQPQVEMTMESDVANRYFQGKENIALALAKRRIKAGGDIKAALALVPITRPIFGHYRRLLEQRYPHLLV